MNTRSIDAAVSLQQKLDDKYGVGRWKYDPSQYKTSAQKMDFECGPCGCLVNRRPNELVSKNTQCPQCLKASQHESRVSKITQRVNKQYGPGRFQLLNPEDYTHQHVDLKFSCSQCGGTWTAREARIRVNAKPTCCTGTHNERSRLKFKAELEQRIQNKFNGTVEILEFKGAHEKVTLQCLKCNETYETYPSHIAKCTHCSNPRTTCIESIQPRTDEVFGVGRYTVGVSKFTEYSAKLPVLCHKCDKWFEKKPADLLTRKRGCPDCQGRAVMNVANRAKELQERINAIHGDRFTLDATQYRGWKVKQPITCNHCGATAPGRPGSLLEGTGIQCECDSAESKGEKAAREFFEEHGIAFEKQWWTPECKHIKPLRFDFLIGKTFIEIDGEQHRKPIAWWGGEEGLRQTQQRDAIKNRWAKENGYEMIRIPYTNTTSIKDILKGIL